MAAIQWRKGKTRRWSRKGMSLRRIDGRECEEKNKSIREKERLSPRERVLAII
ncbi:uncharacterized protein G2W53_028740 [Senna tora]|uniref:Importin N-terminal domain-containing protein n=1 Tax=Senna tora TaxID=362788 RepID=A0A834T5W5_9FABA|nr:uncharacterized protein G2W53_028740 [Senna tora]